MLKTYEREKLIDAIVFFATNTRYCGKIKLIKLLYLLDFELFRQTGRSVSGLEYHAWKMGPVPTEFFEEWDTLADDMAAAIEIRPQQVIDYVRETVVPRREFNPEYFTKRELRVLEDLAQRFRDDFSQPMVNVTHAERGPWAKIWNSGQGYRQTIPYTLAVGDDDPHAEEILEAASEYEAARRTLGVCH